MATEIKFKSTSSQKRWVELQNEKSELQAKKPTPLNLEKIDIISSLMTSCKVGFNLPEAKVKKIVKFLKEETGISKIKYGTMPEGSKPTSILFKDLLILYIEKDGKIIFKEHES